MIRRLLIAPSARDQFHGAKKLTRRNLSSYRLFMEREVIRGLLPVEKIRVYHCDYEFDSYCALDRDRYIIQYCTMEFPGYSLLECLDIQIGCLIHECGHAIFTVYDTKDPSFLEEMHKKYDLPKLKVADIDNMFEDIHIENRLSTEIIGTGTYLMATREYCISRYQEEKLDPENEEDVGLSTLLWLGFNDQEECLSLIKSDRNVFKYTWEDVEKFLVVPKSTMEVHELTEEVLKFMKDEEKDRIRKDEMFENFLRQLFSALGRALMSEEMDNMREQSDKTDKKSASSKGVPVPKINPYRNSDKKPEKSKNLDPKDASIDRDKDTPGETNDNQVKKTKTDESKADLPEYGSEISNEPEYIPEDLEQSQIGQHDVMEGIINQEVNWVRQRVHEDEDYMTYNSIAQKVAPDAAVLRSIFEKYNVGGWKTKSQLENGKIDRRFLHRVPMDDQRVFKQMEKRVNSPLDVITLIDESGSMGGCKYQKAREVAILIHEALLKIPDINYWCYGHTTIGWDGCLMTIYHEGKVTDRMEKYRLARIRAYSGNCDGRAILEAAARVKKRITGDRKVLMILISDGLPSESCEGISPSDFAKRAAIEVETRMGFDFIHVGIECSNHSLYKHSIDYVDNSQLTRVIGELVSNHIQKHRAKL